MQPVPRIFVSATSRDLRTARGLVSEGLRRMECLPIVQDDFPPDYKSVRDMLRTKISTCNAVVHLAGFYYGAEPQPVLPGPDRRSFTQMEYEIAMELKLPCYVFLCGKDFPFDPHDPEPAEKQQLQLAHRERLLQRDELFYEFASPEELANRTRELQLSVEGLRKELARERNRRRVAMAAAATALVLSVGGGAYFLQQHRKVDVVNAQQTSEIASLKAQLEGPWTIVSKVNAMTETLAKTSNAKPDELKKIAVAAVASELGKTLAQIEEAIASATQLAEKLIAAARAEGQTDLAKKEENRLLEIETLQKLGDAHYAGGRFGDALASYEQRLQLLDQKREPARWIEAALDVGDTQRNLGRLDAARKTLQQAYELAGRDTTLAADEPTKLKAERRYVSFLNYADGDRRAAEKTAQAVRTRREKALGEEHIETLRATAALAKIIASEKRFDEAGPLALKAWNTAERVFGKDATETMEIIETAAAILAEQGDLEDAISLQRRVIAHARKTDAGGVRRLENLEIDLADMLRDAREVEEAEKLARSVLSAREKRLGPDDSATRMGVSTLALILVEKKDYVGAEKLYRQKLASEERTLGPEHPTTIDTRGSIGSQLFYQSNYAGAEQMFREMMGFRERKFGPDHPETINAAWRVALCLKRLKKYDEVEKLRRRILAAREAKLGPQAPEVASASSELAEILDLLGRRADAIPFAERAVKIATATLRKEDEDRQSYEAQLTELREPPKTEAKAAATASEAPAASDIDDDGTKSRAARLRDRTSVFMKKKPVAATEGKESPPPTLAEYVDLRKSINDKAKAEKWKEVQLDLAGAGNGRRHYVLGWFEGKKLRKLMKVDATGENDGTFTFYYWSQGWLTSVFRVREGKAVPIEDVAKATDTYNFWNGKLVGWKRTQDDAEKVEGAADNDFPALGKKITAEAEEASAPVLKAFEKE